MAGKQTWAEQWRRGCSFPSALPPYGPVPRIKQGCPGALETELKEGAEPQLSKETRGGGGRDPQPPAWGSALGCWSNSSVKSGLRQPAGSSDHRIADILELKIHGGSKCACVHSRHSGAEALTPTHTAHTRVHAHTVYINIYIAQVYMLFTVYILYQHKTQVFICVYNIRPRGSGGKSHVSWGHGADRKGSGGHATEKSRPSRLREGAWDVRGCPAHAVTLVLEPANN